MSPSRCRAGFLSSLTLGIAVLAAASQAAAGQLTFSVETGAADVRVESASGIDRVSLAGGAERLSEPGHPELPYRVVRVLLPQGETVEGVSFEVVLAPLLLLALVVSILTDERELTSSSETSDRLNRLS